MSDMINSCLVETNIRTDSLLHLTGFNETESFFLFLLALLIIDGWSRFSCPYSSSHSENRVCLSHYERN